MQELSDMVPGPSRSQSSTFLLEQPAPQPAQVLQSPARPPYIEQGIALWERARAFIEAQEAASRAFLADLAMLELADYRLQEALGLRHSADERNLQLLREVIDGVFMFAAREFGPDGRAIDIDRDQFADSVKAFPPDHQNWRDLDLGPLWEAIQAAYGGDSGKEEGYRQIAGGLVEGFSLARETPQQRSGRLIINHSVWCDDFDKKHAGKNRLSYQSLDRLGKLISNLEAFCAWADVPAAHGLQAIIERFSYGLNSHFQSREKHLVVGGRIQLTCFQSRFEFSLAPELGEQLQVFVSTYGQRALNRGR